MVAFFERLVGYKYRSYCSTRAYHYVEDGSTLTRCFESIQSSRKWSKQALGQDLPSLLHQQIITLTW